MQIVAAHLSGNPTSSDAVPALIRDVHRVLVATSGQTEPAAPPKAPAVPIKRSVFPDHIVCLEDGKRFKTLKRHLANSYKMTPDAYRTKWGLPASYPMVAPDYTARRSALAKSIGLALSRALVQSAPAEPTITHGRARRAKGSRG